MEKTQTWQIFFVFVTMLLVREKQNSFFSNRASVLSQSARHFARKKNVRCYWDAAHFISKPATDCQKFWYELARIILDLVKRVRFFLPNRNLLLITNSLCQIFIIFRFPTFSHFRLIFSSEEKRMLFLLQK